MTKTKAKRGNAKCFRLGHWNLELGIYLEIGICDLEFIFLTSNPLQKLTNFIHQSQWIICAASDVEQRTFGKIQII